jgi:hypothetical protein
MALLEILTRNERHIFDAPPQFLSNEDRKKYFALDEELDKIIDKLRGTTNKIGFILQLGYFRCEGKFYLAKDFHKKDLNFIIRHFGFGTDVDFDKYNATSYIRHQELILEYLACTKFDKNIFAKEIERLACKYIRPKQIIIAISESFRRLKIEIPSYNVFAEAITAEYNKTENIILEKIQKQLTKVQIKKIDDLLPDIDEDNEKQPYKRSILTGLRQVKQSLRPKDIKFNIHNFIKIKALYEEFKPIMDNLALSKEAVSYHAIEAIQNYSKKEYKILPHRRVNEKIIIDNWDEILRLMVTIKLKEATASQILKRLSSYAKENPLHKALKEFGRIIKTGFLLTYFDDVALRQRIQKQLNIVELANKFSHAVFFANNHEFSQEDKVDQEIAISCKRLIQNAMILWNYLFLSKLLAECKVPADKDNIISIIINGSILTWSHYNLHGEYDFFKKSVNDDSFHFDLEKILELKVA